MKKIKQKKIKKIGNFLWGAKKTHSNFDKIRFDSDFGLLKATNNFLKAVYYRPVQLKRLDDFKPFVLENERRVDVLLFRCLFYISIPQAYQAVRRGDIYVNHKLCRSPFQLVEPGDIIQVLNPENTHILKLKKTKLNPPIHCAVNYNILSFVYLYSPQYLDVPTSFYSFYTGSVSIRNPKKKQFRKSIDKKAKNKVD